MALLAGAVELRGGRLADSGAAASVPELPTGAASELPIHRYARDAAGPGPSEQRGRVARSRPARKRRRSTCSGRRLDPRPETQAWRPESLAHRTARRRGCAHRDLAEFGYSLASPERRSMIVQAGCGAVALVRTRATRARGAGRPTRPARLREQVVCRRSNSPLSRSGRTGARSNSDQGPRLPRPTSGAVLDIGEAGGRAVGQPARVRLVGASPVPEARPCVRSVVACGELRLASRPPSSPSAARLLTLFGPSSVLRGCRLTCQARTSAAQSPSRPPDVGAAWCRRAARENGCPDQGPHDCSTSVRIEIGRPRPEWDRNSRRRASSRDRGAVHRRAIAVAPSGSRGSRGVQPFD